MPPLLYLTEDWRAEAERKLKSELSPERMDRATTSLAHIHTDCPGGGTKYLLFRLQDGVLTELLLGQGEAPEAEFQIAGPYDVFARIARAELEAPNAILTGKLKLKGNMLKALKLAAIADRVNKVLIGIPSVF
ncbi:MAG: SCP2 sterol-binding domain-containing protein [Acidobacteriota bacterium]|nr:SCP2 sterol-binding domain-containing protein [Acidobacteriota bacterium]